MKYKMCGYPGCNELTSGDYYCPAHKAQQQARRKASAYATATRYANYKDQRWLELRRRYLQMHDHCDKCGSREKLQVHHIIPVRLAPSLFLEINNLMTLCESCHRVVTSGEINSRR